MKLIDSLASEFKHIVESVKSKSVALDILCKNNNHINAPFIRSIIRGADGWYY